LVTDFSVFAKGYTIEPPSSDNVHLNGAINKAEDFLLDLEPREARKSTMSDEEVVRRNKLIAKLLGLDFQEPAEATET
jgi:hypothetical protein